VRTLYEFIGFAMASKPFVCQKKSRRYFATEIRPAKRRERERKREREREGEGEGRKATKRGKMGADFAQEFRFKLTYYIICRSLCLQRLASGLPARTVRNDMESCASK
jgi:hypothetical protein